MDNILKNHGKKVLIDSVISAVVTTIIVYIIVGPYNEDFVKVMQTIADKGLALNVSFVMFFVILIVYLTLNLATLVVKEK